MCVWFVSVHVCVNTYLPARRTHRPVRSSVLRGPFLEGRPPVTAWPCSNPGVQYCNTHTHTNICLNRLLSCSKTLHQIKFTLSFLQLLPSGTKSFQYVLVQSIDIKPPVSSRDLSIHALGFIFSPHPVITDTASAQNPIIKLPFY